MRATFRRLGLGALAYRLYHAPLGAVSRSVAEGGPLEQWRTARGRAEMECAAHSLPVLDFEADRAAPLELHLLTGRQFWYQTAFCLWTFARYAQRPLEPCIYDDGSLDSKHRAALARLFPATRFILQTDTRARLERFLPASRFPYLRERWKHYPNIRKLIDVHLGSSGWKLVIDSDLLFFRRPEFLLRWLEAPSRPLHAVDIETCYGYSPPLLAAMTGAPLAERLNVGLCGLRSEELDWERLEHVCRTLIARAGTHYYLEQALFAVLLAGHVCAVAPAEDYVTLPQPPEVEYCSAVMHHYVAGSKRWYFRQNWRHALAHAGNVAEPPHE
jgi:hypothetical protein